MNSILIALFAIPAISLATPGYYGNDAKIKSKDGKFFYVEQAGHIMKVDSDKLPADIKTTWEKNIGKTFESAIPFAAIVEDKPLTNAKPLSTSGR